MLVLYRSMVLEVQQYAHGRVRSSSIPLYVYTLATCQILDISVYRHTLCPYVNRLVTLCSQAPDHQDGHF